MVSRALRWRQCGCLCDFSSRWRAAINLEHRATAGHIIVCIGDVIIAFFFSLSAKHFAASSQSTPL
jgi:hypothetical protein